MAKAQSSKGRGKSQDPPKINPKLATLPRVVTANYTFRCLIDNWDVFASDNYKDSAVVRECFEPNRVLQGLVEDLQAREAGGRYWQQPELEDAGIGLAATMDAPWSEGRKWSAMMQAMRPYLLLDRLISVMRTTPVDSSQRPVVGPNDLPGFKAPPSKSKASKSKEGTNNKLRVALYNCRSMTLRTIAPSQQQGVGVRPNPVAFTDVNVWNKLICYGIKSKKIDSLGKAQYKLATMAVVVNFFIQRIYSDNAVTAKAQELFATQDTENWSSSEEWLKMLNDGIVWLNMAVLITLRDALVFSLRDDHSAPFMFEAGIRHRQATPEPDFAKLEKGLWTLLFDLALLRTDMTLQEHLMSIGDRVAGAQYPESNRLSIVQFKVSPAGTASSKRRSGSPPAVEDNLRPTKKARMHKGDDDEMDEDDTFNTASGSNSQSVTLSVGANADDNHASNAGRSVSTIVERGSHQTVYPEGQGPSANQDGSPGLTGNEATEPAAGAQQGSLGPIFSPTVGTNADLSSRNDTPTAPTVNTEGQGKSANQDGSPGLTGNEVTESAAGAQQGSLGPIFSPTVGTNADLSSCNDTPTAPTVNPEGQGKSANQDGSPGLTGNEVTESAAGAQQGRLGPNFSPAVGTNADLFSSRNNTPTTPSLTLPSSSLTQPQNDDCDLVVEGPTSSSSPQQVEGPTQHHDPSLNNIVGNSKEHVSTVEEKSAKEKDSEKSRYPQRDRHPSKKVQVSVECGQQTNKQGRKKSRRAATRQEREKIPKEEEVEYHARLTKRLGYQFVNTERKVIDVDAWYASLPENKPVVDMARDVVTDTPKQITAKTAQKSAFPILKSVPAPDGRMTVRMDVNKESLEIHTWYQRDFDQLSAFKKRFVKNGTHEKDLYFRTDADISSHCRGTLQKMKAIIESEDKDEQQRPLNALDLPCGHVPMEIPRLGDMSFRDVVWSYLKHVNRPLYQESIPMDDFRWTLYSSRNAYSTPHVDSNGLCTAIAPVNCKKLWILGRHLKESLQDSRALKKFRMYDINLEEYEWTPLLIKSGDILYMKPGTVHAVVTIDPGFTVGEHFYTMETLEDSLASLFHLCAANALLTNATHNIAVVKTLARLLRCWRRRLCSEVEQGDVPEFKFGNTSYVKCLVMIGTYLHVFPYVEDMERGLSPTDIKQLERAHKDYRFLYNGLVQHFDLSNIPTGSYSFPESKVKRGRTVGPTEVEPQEDIDEDDKKSEEKMYDMVFRNGEMWIIAHLIEFFANARKLVHAEERAKIDASSSRLQKLIPELLARAGLGRAWFDECHKWISKNFDKSRLDGWLDWDKLEIVRKVSSGEGEVEIEEESESEGSGYDSE